MNQKMPKCKADFQTALEFAFKSGCLWGYSVDLEQDVSEQEHIGFLLYIGEISQSEATQRLNQIFNLIDGEQKSFI